ncbi:hypothetical protein FRX31_017573 [Thalictrum thalictroides]|uniref:Uncharacterized protein n=1 Tax=Thalictrum thalictroides TaxID=46969 RepID=A0A7J6W8E5_THATH|nr:hypothetical protein FRX31_017573 [Thalictrum thalictroides]
MTKAKGQKNIPMRYGKTSGKLPTRWSNRIGAHGGDHFGNKEEFSQGLNPTEDFNSEQGILGEDELHDDFSLNEEQVDIDGEDGGNIGNALFDDELSEDDSNYVASEDTSFGVDNNNDNKSEFITRGKEALGDIDRINVESYYDSPDLEVIVKMKMIAH